MYDELAERLVGGMLGYGRQHKAFMYSKPDLTTEEKAVERSAHYRKKKQVAEGRYVGVRKAQVQPLRKVTWTDEDKAREEARGVKEPTPKKESERKPYVGSVMKKKLFVALGLEEDSKEGRKALREASRKYKEGGVSWEDVIASAQ